MDRLPAELMDRIVVDAIMDQDQIAALAGVSRRFQAVVERHTFARFFYLSTDDIPQARSIFGRVPHRVENLVELRIKIERMARIDQIIALFDFLSWLQRSPFIKREIRLSITADIPSTRDCQALLNYSTGAAQLQFPFVNNLYFGGLSPNYFSNTRAIRCMMSNFACLDGLTLDFNSINFGPSDPKQRIQSEIVDTLNHVPPVKSFRLYSFSTSRDHLMTLLPGDSEDRVTSALRQLSQKLEVLMLDTILASPQLFWPDQTSPELPAPYWPDLSECVIRYITQMPNGKLFFGQRKPIQAHFDEFYRAAALAITRMPKLKKMILDAQSGWTLNREFDYHLFIFKVEGNVATATWECNPKYVPCDEVIQILEQVALDRDLELVVEYIFEE
ncbi:hypothetical protein F4776DRAFT_63437 [Hypoxylon sp. NC0597]|nr:hypothetical protein F4776DRAFT_63437 [Hypoxylon sp. NC0597]